MGAAALLEDLDWDQTSNKWHPEYDFASTVITDMYQQYTTVSSPTVTFTYFNFSWRLLVSSDCFPVFPSPIHLLNKREMWDTVSSGMAISLLGNIWSQTPLIVDLKTATRQFTWAECSSLSQWKGKEISYLNIKSWWWKKCVVCSLHRSNSQ